TEHPGSARTPDTGGDFRQNGCPIAIRRPRPRNAIRARRAPTNTSPLDECMKFRSTTILTARRGDYVAMGGDGQVTLGQTVMKSDARKVRRVGDGRVLAGFAGAAADAFALLERFE